MASAMGDEDGSPASSGGWTADMGGSLHRLGRIIAGPDQCVLLSIRAQSFGLFPQLRVVSNNAPIRQPLGQARAAE